jgi:nitrogen fixation-related uncharacterized protein
MTWTYLFIWGSWIIFGATTVWALAWAINSGQFSKIQKGARSIFDDEEPVDEMTDFFPDVEPSVVEEYGSGEQEGRDD